MNESKEKVFSKEKVDELNKYQEEGKFHPYTCPNDGDKMHVAYEFAKQDSLIEYEDYLSEARKYGIPHPEMEFKQTKLIATEEGWICPCCNYTQNWAH